MWFDIISDMFGVCSAELGFPSWSRRMFGDVKF
jgi:hypothetical protein